MVDNEKFKSYWLCCLTLFQRQNTNIFRSNIKCLNLVYHACEWSYWYYNFWNPFLVNRIGIPLVHYANNQNGDDWSSYCQSNCDVRTGLMSSLCYMRLYIYVFIEKKNPWSMNWNKVWVIYKFNKLKYLYHPIDRTLEALHHKQISFIKWNLVIEIFLKKI